MTIKEQVLRTIQNHKNCTSGGIAQIINCKRITVLRALSELIKDGEIRQQKGRVLDGDPDPRFRSYKLARTKYSQPSLF